MRSPIVADGVLDPFTNKKIKRREKPICTPIPSAGIVLCDDKVSYKKQTISVIILVVLIFIFGSMFSLMVTITIPTPSTHSLSLYTYVPPVIIIPFSMIFGYMLAGRTCKRN